MSFVNSQGPMPGQDYSVPDIYIQTAPTGPVPVPLVSQGFRSTEIPTCFRSLIMCMPAHNVSNYAPVTVSGPGPGAASGMICSTSRNVKGSSKLFLQGMPATRSMMDPTAQNGITPNSVGNTVAPCQIRLMNPSP